MNTATRYEMTTSHGMQIPLVKTSIQAELRDTALETTVIQHYRNDEQETIEAVYTFPLPVGATLLSLEVNLNGEVRVGTVVASKDAEEAYEDAITDGDSALLLQKVDEALYTLNIGNLQPEDSAIITIRYLQLLCWQQNTLRIMYPTTIGDRYGQPAGLGLHPHQVTHEDPGFEHHADFSLTIVGQLAGCTVASPSHLLSIKSGNEQLLITSSPNGLVMDRDIVITLERSHASTGCAGYFDRDLDGKWVGWLSVYPEVSNPVQQRNTTIVVDCSGSMAGISNQQARIAVREIVENLNPGDMFNIIKFGSHATALFPEALPGNDTNKSAALKLIADMNADMGGTEIGDALHLAYKGAKGMRDVGDILLITDGQSYDVENVIEEAIKSQIRHFIVGVGTAVAEDMVQGLSQATGGAHEFVSPNENMAAAIVRHIKRSYAARLTKSEINWPINPERSIPKMITHAFSGDTLHLFAQFDTKPEGEADIRLEFGDQTWTQSIPMSAYSKLNAASPLEELRLARVCAAKQIQLSTDDAEKQRLGIQYQLQTNTTSYLLIAKRESKDDSLAGPAFRPIPQMSKANGRVDALSTSISENIIMGKAALTPRYDKIPVFLSQDAISFSKEANTLFRVASPIERAHSPEYFVSNLNKYFRQTFLFRSQTFPTSFAELAEFGIDNDLLDSLRNILTNNDAANEAELVSMVLFVFLKHPAAVRLERRAKRSITKSGRKLKSQEVLEKAVWEVFGEKCLTKQWRIGKW